MKISIRSWQLVAWAALVLTGLAAAVGVWLVIRNPLLAVTFGVTAVLALVVGWRMVIAAKSARMWVYLSVFLVLVGLMLAEAELFFRHQHNFRGLLATVVLAAVGLGLAAAVRRHIDSSRAAEVALREVGGRVYLIVNPKSGDGRAIKAHIPELARARGIKVLMLEPGGSFTGLVEQAVKSGATELGISGGDGSIGVAAGEAMRHDIPLVVLPGGTRCHFARDLGLDPNRIADALRCFGGKEVQIDAGMINDRVFLNNASFGIYADIVRQPDYRDRKLQSAAEVLGRHATDEGGYDLEFKDATGAVHQRAVVVLVGVNRYETMRVMELGSRRRLDEGVLQVTSLLRLQPSMLKEMAGVVRTSRADNPDLLQWVQDEFEIRGPGATLEAGVDGELVELDSPVRLRVLPRALRLMVLPEGMQGRATAAKWLGNLEEFASHGRWRE